MDPWTVGLGIIVVVGLALIIYGALSDRSKNKRRAAEMLAPPQRNIPNFQPDAPAPHYLSELQARRDPEDGRSTELSSAGRQKIKAELASGPTKTISVGYATPSFVTDQTSSLAILESPRILICAAPVTSLRELLPVMERFVLSHTPLIVCAPELSDDVLKTLEVNKIQQKMSTLVIVTTDTDLLSQIATATGGSAVERTDLQASYVTPSQLGTCERWVSSAKESFVIGSPEPLDSESAPE